MANDDSSQQNTNNVAYGQNDQYLGSAAQQVARRPQGNNQNLVQAQYEGTAAHGQWAANGEQTPQGDWSVQYNDLDQQADVAKRDAQAKRKQIPPFIQKLSR